MSNLVLSEWYKLRKDPAFRILCLALIVMGIAYPLLLYWDRPSEPASTEVLSGIELFVKAVGGNVYFLKIGLAIFAGFFISSEYSTGVMKRTASAGSSRRRIYTAKLTVYALGGVIISALFPVMNAVVGSLLFGFGRLTEVAAIDYFFRTIGFTALFAAAFASIVALFAVILTDSGKTIGITIVFFFFIDGLFEIGGKSVPLIKTIYDYSVFKLFYTSAEFKMANDDLLFSVIVPILTFAAFALLGILAFNRKEIK